ncbi:MAG TPA: UDP-N-acetylglucosamine 2-epimerase (non-hydrolyzing) [Flavobacteriaceae bacterium]|nr:UDP-N-acetylglucosamine 2-epimerase (non-hydrolyzing) [Flavobacteriaceae bacterium]
MEKKKHLFVFGTRPEAIKMAPVVHAFQKEKGFDTRVCITAQHREMLDQVLEFFSISADYDLDLMKPGQSLYSLTAAIITGMQSVLEDYNPDFVYVHGDTTTSSIAALAAFYNGSKVCHIEAGLRTFNKWAPFPEEMNRQLTGRLTDLHFAPTDRAKANLLKEGTADDQIFVTGNTVIDALMHSVETVTKTPSPLIQETEDWLGERTLLLITGHRRENHGEGFERICKALQIIAKNNPEIALIYPVHLNPNVQEPVKKYLQNIPNIKLLEPLAYQDFIWLMHRSKLIITDSGGVQEEAPSLGKPVLVMRDTTERPEAVEAGTVILVGTDTDRIVSETEDLLHNTERYNRMSALHNPYGDGTASQRIVEIIKNLDTCK